MPGSVIGNTREFGSRIPGSSPGRAVYLVVCGVSFTLGKLVYCSMTISDTLKAFGPSTASKNVCESRLVSLITVCKKKG